MVLTLRKVHNWFMSKDKKAASNAFKSFYTALKPGGTLGVVEHRLPEEQADEMQKSSGYMKQSVVIALAEQAGLTCKNGIITDNHLETSAKNIFALGDCAEIQGEVRLYVLPLMARARALAKTLAGETTPVNFGIMPIATKTPACPVVTVPPKSAEGAWSFEQTDTGLIGKVINSTNKTSGFVLTGDALSHKADLIKEMNQ